MLTSYFSEYEICDTDNSFIMPLKSEAEWGNLITYELLGFPSNDVVLSDQ